MAHTLRVLYLYPEVGAPTRWTELLSIGSTSALIKQGGSRVDLLTYKHHSQLEAVDKALANAKIDIVLAHIAWDQWRHAVPLLKAARKALPKATIVAAGPYPTLDPDSPMDDPSVNALALGENEAALNDLVQTLAGGKSPSGLQNFWFKQPGGGLEKNSIRPMIENIDSLPFSDRTLYDHAALVRMSGGGTPMMAGRGCPFECLFCYMPRLKAAAAGKGEFVRSRTPLNIIAEVKELAKRDRIHWVDFVDEYFPQEVNWLSQFSTHWKSQLRLPFRFTAVAEKINLQTLGMLQDAGCAGIRVGVETGNERFRGRVAKRNLDNARIEALCEEARRCGIEIETHNMTGIPLENPELAKETAAFNLRLKPDSLRVHIFQPLAGSALFAYCQDKEMWKGGAAGADGDADEEEADSDGGAAVPSALPPMLVLPSIRPEEVLASYENLTRLNRRLLLDRAPLNAGSLDLAGIADSHVAEAAAAAFDVGIHAVEGDERLCLLQPIGTTLKIPVTLMEEAWLSFGLSLGPSPFGFRNSRPVRVEAHVRKGEQDFLAFFKILHPPETAPSRGWMDLQLPLWEWAPGPVEIVLKTRWIGPKPPAPLFVAWSRPVVAGHRSMGGPSESANPLGTTGQGNRAAQLQKQLKGFEEEQASLRRQLEEARHEVDAKKKRVAELLVESVEQGKELETLRAEKAEWEQVKAELEKSMGEKLKRLFRKS